MTLLEFTIERDSLGFWRPRSEDELRTLVRGAARRGLQVRVRGAAHSVSGAVYTDRYFEDRWHPAEMNILLDRYTDVRIDAAARTVTAKAGCHLGLDPHAPHGLATVDRALLHQLDRRGLALSTLGGISHQTVAGFLATGSSGGTLRWSAHDAIRRIRLIDAEGDVRELTAEGDRDLFHAAGVSMGLLGVISEVTLTCEPRYDITGFDLTRPVARLPFDLFEDGAVERFFREAEYARMMWWPQPGVDRVSVWRARRMRPEDYDALRAPGGVFRPRPFREISSNPILQHLGQVTVGAFYSALGRAPRTEPFVSVSQRLLPHVIRAFVREDGDERDSFWESWHTGLPLDNQMSDALMPMNFSELWVPIERGGELLRALRDHFLRGGFRSTGNFAYEVYPALRSPFWLHPAYERDSLRLDILWYAHNAGDPAREFFESFWKLLRPFGFRLHWGKYIPHRRTPWDRDPTHPELGSWADYLAARYPRWEDFLRVRRELDPHGRFLTGYWRARLGVSAP